MIEYLAAENVRATFFQCGVNVIRHRAVARQIYAAGHEIGNHTYSHPWLCPHWGRRLEWRSAASVYEEFALAQMIIQSELGVRPTLLRAPYGSRWFGMREAQRDLGLLCVMWTVIGPDWKRPASTVERLVLEQASPGGIVCLHDGRTVDPNPDVSETLKAVQAIVPRLRDQGYRFETVSEILHADTAVAA